MGLGLCESIESKMEWCGNGFVIPAAVKKTAQLSLALKKVGFAGGVETGIKRAQQLARCKRIRDEDALVMRNWFARHGPNAKNGGTSYRGYSRDKAWIQPLVNAVVRGTKTPAQAAKIAAETRPRSKSRGAIAWLLWGGDAGYNWIWVNKFKERKSPRIRGGAKLCKRGVATAKAKFKVWPSAYASGYASQVCRGEKPGLDGKRRSDKAYVARLRSQRASKKNPKGIARWFKEKWVDVCTIDQKGGPKPCGRKKTGKGASRKYPYCRPSVRVSPKTPVTWKQMSRADIAAACRSKQSTPTRRQPPARSSPKRRSAKRSRRRSKRTRSR